MEEEEEEEEEEEDEEGLGEGDGDGDGVGVEVGVFDSLKDLVGVNNGRSVFVGDTSVGEMVAVRAGVGVKPQATNPI